MRPMVMLIAHPTASMRRKSGVESPSLRRGWMKSEARVESVSGEGEQCLLAQ
jgi:hypothetical protein